VQCHACGAQYAPAIVPANAPLEVPAGGSYRCKCGISYHNLNALQSHHYCHNCHTLNEV
jgi:hypothetical protein